MIVMPVAYIAADKPEEILPFCASLTPQVEPFKEEGIFLGLDAAGVERLAASKILKRGKYAVAGSKLTARAACMLLPAGKSVCLKGDEEAAFLAPLPVDCLWPLDVNVIEHLKILGLHRVGEVAGISKEELCLQLGEREGRAVYNYSRGIDNRPVLPKYPPDSLQVKRTLEGTINKEGLKSILSEMFSAMAQKLSSQNQGLQSLCVEFIEENGHTSSIKRSFLSPVSIFGSGLVESIAASAAINSPLFEVRVIAGNLKPLRLTQGSLWEDRLFSGKKIDEVHCLAASMQESLPHQKICFASDLQVSRRERVLSLWDPFRFTKSAPECLRLKPGN